MAERILIEIDRADAEHHASTWTDRDDGPFGRLGRACRRALAMREAADELTKETERLGLYDDERKA